MSLARLRLLFRRRAAEARMHDEIRFHVEMEADQLMRDQGLAPDEARRRALVAFGGVEKHKQALRDGRGLAWLSGMSLDVRLGGRMLLKFPGLTLAGGLALAIGIAVGAGWYDLSGTLFSPVIPLPEGDRIVLIETRDTQANALEPRVLRDFLEWRRYLRTIEGLGAYRTHTRNLIVGTSAPESIQVAEITADAFRTAHVAPLIGRGLIAADEVPGAPSVVVIGYEVWQRRLGGRHDVAGAVVHLGNTPATVIGVMPEAFAFPYNHSAWTPLSPGITYGALEGGAISVIGRLAQGVSREQADAELQVVGARTAAALPATHAHLRPSVRRLGEAADVPGVVQLALRNGPVLLVLAVACLSVGTLVYARTATREGEIAVRTALGASRARIIGQLFVEALVLASIAAAIGLLAADRVLTWAITNVTDIGGAPFWMTPGLKGSTLLYAGGLAVVSAAMVSVLPALRATRARVQPHLVHMGSGGATLKFGRVWTGAMVVQVALTAVGIPVAMESTSQTIRKVGIRATFPSREYLAAYVDLDRPFLEESTSAFEERRAQAWLALERRIAQEPGVTAVTFADRAPGTLTSSRAGEVEPSSGAGPPYGGGFRLLAVGPDFFEAFDRPAVAGRVFDSSDWQPTARTVVVNEAFARACLREAGIGSPVGARLRYRGARQADDAVLGDTESDTIFEIVGVVRDVGLDPDDSGDELPYVFHRASAGTVSPLVLNVRVRGNPESLAARLPVIAADVDAQLLVRDAQPLDAWVRDREEPWIMQAGALAAVNLLVLFLSALGIFSLVAVNVSRRTREIGLRTALGANPRQLLVSILFRAGVLMGTGIAAGSALLLWFIAVGGGPSGRAADDVALFAVYLGVTSAVMCAAGLMACIAPARRALRINPSQALREA